MKNILVPTDFSLCAMRAMDIGMALAEFFGAKIHFFTSIDDCKNGERIGNSISQKTTVKREIMDNINVLFNKWKTEAKLRGIAVQAICSSGELIPSIKDYVETHNIDFVVMGSHGHSGIQGYYIGSNCQKVVRSLHVPVFIIKDDLKKYEFKSIVYASSFKEEERSSFIHFLNFIKKFKPEKIHLLAINTSSWPRTDTSEIESAMQTFQKMCDFAICQRHLFVDSFIESGIRHFSENIDTDLVVISNHHRHPLKRIFSGSTVEALVQNTNLPVLSIDFNEEIGSEFMIGKKL